MPPPLWPFRRERAVLAPALAERVARWRALPESWRERRPGAGRWVVVDVESGGLDPRRDALISVGALGVTDGAIGLADSFEVVLRQAAPSAGGNIEVHGIAGTEQMQGEDPAAALADFLAFAGKDPLVAFHAAFDARLLARAIDRHLGVPFRRPWVDLAHIAPLAWPRLAGRRAGLDDWLAALAIPAPLRHRAIGDCLATAELLLMALAHAGAIGASTAGTLVALSGGDGLR